MSRAEYEEIFNEQMDRVRTQTQPKTSVVQSIKERGFTMDDWATAGKAYGIPQSLPGGQIDLAVGNFTRSWHKR